MNLPDLTSRRDRRLEHSWIVSTDWQEWHELYDDPGSSLGRRLGVVRHEVRRLLEARRGSHTQLTSICAGDGRDVLPVLEPFAGEVDAALVEIDGDLAGRARNAAADLGLTRVEVRTSDAGLSSTFVGMARADVFLACGVFGNITDADLETTIGALPALVAPDGAVVWTRGAHLGDNELSGCAGDPADLVREVFARHGFVEERFVRPEDAGFRVGVHRRAANTDHATLPPRMFTFAR